jgi:myo-inositol 2-dehydrogenase / D-chiro-inositol 1-dehydrogenase
MNQLRIGIVGCGRMGHERARSCAITNEKVVVLCDPDSSRARSLANKHPSSRAVETPAEIPWSSLDAIFICTPPGQRDAIELQAIDAGKPFFVEKPIGVSVAHGDRVLKALRSRPVIHAVGYMNRYRTSVLHARKVLSGRRVLGFACHWNGRKYSVPWWLDKSLSGGPLNEQATHLVDLARILAGEIKSTCALSSLAPRSDPPLTFAVLFRFENGSVGTAIYSCQAKEKDIAIRVLTDEGVLELTGWDFKLTTNTIDETFPPDETEDIFLKETQRFLTAVRRSDQGVVECGYADAHRTQSVVDAIQHSLKATESVLMAGFCGTDKSIVG